MYKKIVQADIEFLSTFIDSKHLFFGGAINEDYAHDELAHSESFPEVVVKVNTTEEISKILRYASQQGIPVVPRGSGTGLVGSAVAIYGGIMLDMTGMNKILELDSENLILTVEPGVLIMDIHKYVESFDFFYPPDPGEKSATIGGNISTNAGGMRAVKYGVTKDYVLGLEVVLPSGEIIELGGKNVKNSSGYDLRGLMVGSEGTLGVITKAILRLLPKPKFSMSLLVPFATMEEAIECVPRIMQSSIIPTAVEFMQKEVILMAEQYLDKEFPDQSSDAYLLLSFDGSTQSQVNADYELVADLCLAYGAKDVFIVDTQERRESVWSARGAFLEGIHASTSEMDECDVVVPRNKIPEFIKFTKSVEQKHGVRLPYFGHAGDGNLHIYICKDELESETFQLKLEAIFDELYKKAEELKGNVSGEHGIGYAKKPYLLRQYGESTIQLMNQIKLVFDPKNILNPGKVCQ